MNELVTSAPCQGGWDKRCRGVVIIACGGAVDAQVAHESPAKRDVGNKWRDGVGLMPGR